MRDLSPKWMYVKFVLFLVIGGLSGTAIIIATPRWDVVLLLGLCVWAFARAYYFAFYVIEHYVDPSYRFAGLMDFAKYLVRRREG